MPFTHYPKLEANVIFAWVWPRPLAKPNFLNHPSFDEINLAKEPLAPGETLTAYHSAQNFTRFYGSIASDQPLEVTCDFSNDEVAPTGDYVTDENMKDLNYDASGLVQKYDPSKQAATGKYFVIIFGRWLRVEVKNLGTRPTETLRVFVRGSVF